MSVWRAADTTVSIFDVNTVPTSFACNPSVVGQYEVNFNDDCSQFKLNLKQDQCTERAQLYNQLSVTLTGVCTDISEASTLMSSMFMLLIVVILSLLA
jgi:hypothetical protein